MEATEYGLSKLNTSLSKKDREKQWKAIYPTNTCLFTHGRDLSSCVIRILHMDRLRELSLDLSKKNRAVHAVCVIVALKVDLMNDQVSSLQRNGIAENLHRPFYRLYLVESTRRSMKDF